MQSTFFFPFFSLALPETFVFFSLLWIIFFLRRRDGNSAKFTAQQKHAQIHTKMFAATTVQQTAFVGKAVAMKTRTSVRSRVSFFVDRIARGGGDVRFLYSFVLFLCVFRGDECPYSF